MNIVITGVSSGIGYALAKKFILNGHQVFALARNEERLNQLELELKSTAFQYLPFDLSDKDYKNELIPAIHAHFEQVDILINNAGLLMNKPLEELSDIDFDQVFAVNMKSPFKLIRDLIPMINKGGHIVNISSMGAFQGSAKFPGLSLYSASKAALAVFTECLAEELKTHEISANALALGAVQTEMLAEAFPGYKAPLQANDMADFIFDFALNGNRFYNGKILPVSLSTP